MILLIARLAAGQAPAWDQYQVLMWSTGNPVDPARWIDRLRELGFTGEECTGCDAGPYVKAGFNFYLENMVQDLAFLHDRAPLYQSDWDHYTKPPHDKSYLVRKPSLNDPAFWQSVKPKVQSLVRDYSGRHPLLYQLRDELSIGSYASPMDYDFDPHALQEFRIWLHGVYGSLDALNREWGTQFVAWDDVQPLDTYEIKARGGENYAPWADHREFMDVTMAAALDRLRSYVREIDRQVPVGIEGTQMPSAWGGFDLWRLSRAVDWVEPYDIAGAREIWRSFLPPGAIVLNTVFGDDIPHIRQQLWTLLLDGNRGVLIWDDDKSRMILKDNPAMPVTDRGRDLAPVIQELRKAAPQIFKLRRVNDRIAIHYSQASIRAHWMFDSREDGATWPRRFSSFEATHSRLARVRESFMRVVEDLGLGYNFVSYQQIEDGGLEGYKVLLLPQSVAMSAAECRRIEEFVREGGTVIADNMTATMDEHCRRLPKGQLDELFGIQSKSDPDVSVAGGYAQRRSSNGVPMIILNHVGKGHTVYLNLDMHEYGKLRLQPPGGESIRELFEPLLREAGVTPPLRVLDARDGKPVPCVRVWRFAGEDGAWFAVMRNNSAIDAPVKVRIGSREMELDATRPLIFLRRD